MGIHYDPSKIDRRVMVRGSDRLLMPPDTLTNDKPLGLFRGLLFALPASGILWAALFLGSRWLLG